ncbi:PMS1 protein homolog 1 [Rhinophrynus dorsalis]
MHHLPSSTIRLLSSSQVITSVVSVVKELVENALDANATNIDIKLDNFGFDKIEVRDNGNGIKAADTPVMGIKHYTSKIKSHEDLEMLETYGFRGEALASVCSVAEVQITTKTAADEFSTQYILDSNGHVVSQKPSHLGQGTTVCVLKLFKNLPVRKQYYSTTKKCKEEIRRIQDLLMAYGIIIPGLRVVFTHNKEVIWQKSKVSDHKMSFMSVLGTAVMSSMVPFEHQSDDQEILINGFLPKPEVSNTLTSLSSSERSFLFINRRPVHHKDILKMVRLHYNQSLKKDSPRCYPLFFMNITLPTSSVDVNLTPDKTQIMLQDKESVLLAVENVLRSVYPGSVILETDKADMMSEDIVINSTQPADAQLGKKNISGIKDSNENNSSINNNGQAEKELEVCLKHQIFNTDNIPDPDKGEVSGINYESSDQSINSLTGDESQKDYGLTFAIGDNILKSTQPNNDFKSPYVGHDAEIETCKKATLIDGHEISDVNWSKGNALKNSIFGDIEPVKILGPRVESDVENSRDTNNDQRHENTKKEISNGISGKSGFITAYDLISSRAIRKPLSSIDLFMQDHRSKLLDDPKANMEDVSLIAERLWNQLNQEEKQRYEEKAAKELQRYNLQTTKATEQNIQKSRETEKRQKLTSGHSSAQKVKLKTALSNQQILDKLFHSQTEKKKTTPPIKIVQVAFSLRTLKQRLCKLPENQTSGVEEFCLISKLSFPGAWIVASESKITLLNPYRAEEAMLFKCLVENHKIAAEKLESPVILTDRLLGGSQYLDALSDMQRGSPKINGEIYFTDSRLTANGFQIKIIPGMSFAESHIEIEGMASSLPFYGISDLKEILNSAMNKKSKELCDCRPLKVLNYLEGEAVRLSRQMPYNLSKDDVSDTLNRLKQQLGNGSKGCIHGRPFFHHLTDLPETG